MLKMKTSEMAYMLYARACRIQVDVGGPAGWQAQTGRELVRY